MTVGRSGIASVVAVALVASLLSIVAVSVRVTQPSTGTVFGAPDAPTFAALTMAVGRYL